MPSSSSKHRFESIRQTSYLLHTRYDGLNRRVTAPEVSTVRHFYYTSDWRLVETRLASQPDVAEYTYLWGQRYIDDLVFRSVPGSGTSVDPSIRVYALQDANWNVTAICDGAGDVMERYCYTPYGVPTFLDAQFEPQLSSPNNWTTLYAGYWWESQTGLNKVRRRDLHPLVGMWLTRDPIGYRAGDVNLYRYVANRPTSLLDPAGLVIEFEGDEQLIRQARKLLETIYMEADAELRRLIDAINRDTTTCRIKVVVNTRDAIIGSFAAQTIDLGDIGQFPDTGPTTKKSAFIHEVYEQWLKQKEGRAAKEAHQEAFKVEKMVTGWTRGQELPYQVLAQDAQNRPTRIAVPVLFSREIEVTKDGKVSKETKSVVQTVTISLQTGNVERVEVRPIEGGP